MKELENLSKKEELSDNDVALLAMILSEMTDEQSDLLNEDLDRIYKCEEQYNGMRRA